MLVTGQVYEATYTVHDLDAEPSTVALTITKPDGTAVDPAPTIGAPTVSGRDYTYTYDYTLPAAGIYIIGPWVTQGPGTSQPPEYITVREFRSLISLAEAREHVNFKRADNDTELQRFMMAATELVEAKGGPTIRRTVTERVTHGTFQLAVSQFPLLSVTSVTSTWAGGPSWVTADLDWDADAGIIWAKAMTPFWWPPWNIVEVVGRAVPLESHLQACKEQLRHLWDTQRGSMPPSALGAEETYTTATGFSFSVPRRVLELLENEMTPAI